MNDTRRRKVRKVIKSLDLANDILKDVLEDEDEARNNTPEALQGLDRYSESEDASDLLSDAISSLEECIEHLDKVI